MARAAVSILGVLARFTLRAAAQIPHWTAPLPDPSAPLAGYPQLPNTTYSNIYMADPVWGTYSHIPHLTVSPGNFIFTTHWTNSPRDEGEPGSRVIFAQSADGVHWSQLGVMCPNISTSQRAVVLIAEPFVWIGSRLYAACSLSQFELMPPQHPELLLLRRVHYEGATAWTLPTPLGPLFWAVADVPPDYVNVSAWNGIVGLAVMDAQTQADVAQLVNPTLYGADGGWMPCVNLSTSTKCEACPGGCQPWTAVNRSLVVNERTHYSIVPANGRTGSPDVLLYRSSEPNGPAPHNNTLWASVRSSPNASWPSELVKTSIPNQPSNINAGYFRAGPRYLVLNPNESRDPLVLATSADGWTWDRAWAIVSCAYLGPNGTACSQRWPGFSVGTGVAYPQSLVLDDPHAPPAMRGMWTVFSNNKEDMWMAFTPLQALSDALGLELDVV